MTNVHVICFGVCYQHRGVKVGEGGLGGGVDVIWKQSPPVSSEKWQQSTTAPCDQIQSICLVLCSGKLRASFSDGSYNIIIPRKDLSQIHRFLSEITVLEFFIYLFFIHSCMGGIWISSFTSYLLYQGCALGSPRWLLSSWKKASKNLSLSPDLLTAAHVKSGEAACLITGLILQCSGCVTECCDSRPHICSLTHWDFLNLPSPTRHFNWTVQLSLVNAYVYIHCICTRK